MTTKAKLVLAAALVSLAAGIVWPAWHITRGRRAARHEKSLRGQNGRAR